MVGGYIWGKSKKEEEKPYHFPQIYPVNWNIYSHVPASWLQHALAHKYLHTYTHSVHVLSATITHRQSTAIHSQPAQKQSNDQCQAASCSLMKTHSPFLATISTGIHLHPTTMPQSPFNYPACSLTYSKEDRDDANFTSSYMAGPGVRFGLCLKCLQLLAPSLPSCA